MEPDVLGKLVEGCVIPAHPLALTSDKKLDERELQVTNTGLKYAYAIFTVTALVAIYWHAITEIQVNGLTAAGLLYLAHILPATVIGWREEDIAWGND